jgi:hypothetical protein
MIDIVLFIGAKRAHRLNYVTYEKGALFRTPKILKGFDSLQKIDFFPSTIILIMGNQNPKYLPKEFSKEREEEIIKAGDQSVAIETQNLINAIEHCMSRKEDSGLMRAYLFQPTIDRLESAGYKLSCTKASPHDTTDLEQRCTIYCNK